MRIPPVDNFGARESTEGKAHFIGLKPGFQIERNVDSKILDFALKSNSVASKKLVQSEIVRAVEPLALMLNALSRVRILENGRCFVRSVPDKRRQENITIQLPEPEWLKGVLDLSPIMSFKVYANQALLLKNRSGKVMPQSSQDLELFLLNQSKEVLQIQDSSIAGIYFIYRFAYMDRYDNDFYISLAKSEIPLDLGLAILEAGEFKIEDFDMIKNGTRSQVESILVSSIKN